MLNERDFIVDMVDEGLLEPKYALAMCLQYLSLDDVRDMIDANELDSDLAKWRKLNQVAA